MTTETPIQTDILTDRIVRFINGIGIPCRQHPVGNDTFLPGIDIKDGCILYDPERMLSPGDLLHEAGHAAVLRPADRKTICSPDKINGDLQAGGAEMGAIAWSWAALRYLQLDPIVVFHEQGYKGGADEIINNFSNGRYMGVELLQWMGMTTAPKHDTAPDEYTYPKMKAWVRP